MSRITEEELIERLAEMTAAGVPLHEGLRAAALDAGPSSTARQLDRMASNLRQAESLETALAQIQPALSEPLQGVIRAGLEAGQLDQVLAELVQQERSRRDMRRELFNTLTYPLVVTILFLVVTAGVLSILAPQMSKDFREFEVELPQSTQLVLWVALSGLPLLGKTLLGLALFAVIFRLVFGPVRWRRLLVSVPLFGPLLQWSGAYQWAVFMRLLLNAQVPIPEALSLTGRAIRDPNMAATSEQVAKATQKGRSLGNSLAESAYVSPVLATIVGWGEANNRLVESMTMAAEIFQGQIHLRSKLLQNVLPPLIFITIAMLTVGLASSLILFPVQLLTSLYGIVF